MANFEWDENKAVYNRKTHRVTFEEAQTIFDDPLAVIFPDDWQSTEEERELIIGHSNNNRMLIVCFTERAHAIRLISAPEVTPKERRDYEKNTRF